MKWIPTPGRCRSGKSRPRRRRAGLTLVEVMLAVLVIGIGITTLVAAASRCLAVARKAKHFEKARHMLSRVEVEFPLQLEEEIEPGSDGGSFSGEDQDYQWQRIIEEVGEEDEGLYRVTTRILWSELGKKSSEEIVSMLYAPKAKEGGSFERPAG